MDMKLLDSFLSIARLGDYNHVLLGANNGRQSFTDNRVIVDDQNANWCAKYQSDLPGILAIVAKERDLRIKRLEIVPLNVQILQTSSNRLSEFTIRLFPFWRCIIIDG